MPQAVLEFDEFTGLCMAQSVDACNTVSYLKDGAHFFQLRFGVELGELLTKDRRYFCWLDVCHFAGFKILVCTGSCRMSFSAR